MEDVLALSRVRQLVSSADALYAALESSPFIDLILPEKEQELRKQMKAEKSENPEDDKKADDERKEEVDSKKKNEDKEKGEDGADDGDDDEDESTKFHPEFVGRARFSPPTEKQFPFRRYVLLLGNLRLFFGGNVF